MSAIDTLRNLIGSEPTPEDSVDLGRVIVPPHIKKVGRKLVRVDGYTYIRRGGKTYRVKKDRPARKDVQKAPTTRSEPASEPMMREGNVDTPMSISPVADLSEAWGVVSGAKAHLINIQTTQPTAAGRLDALSSTTTVAYLKQRRKILHTANDLATAPKGTPENALDAGTATKGQKISVSRERGRIETLLRASHLNNRLKKGTITAEDAEKELEYLRSRMGNQPVSAKDSTPKYVKVFGPDYPIDPFPLFDELEMRVGAYTSDDDDVDWMNADELDSAFGTDGLDPDVAEIDPDADDVTAYYISQAEMVLGEASYLKPVITAGPPAMHEVAVFQSQPDDMVKAFASVLNAKRVGVTGPKKISYVLETKNEAGQPQTVYINFKASTISVRTYNTPQEEATWTKSVSWFSSAQVAINFASDTPNGPDSPNGFKVATPKTKQEITVEAGIDPDTASKQELMAWIKSKGGEYVGTMSKEQNADWVKYHTGLASFDDSLDLKYGPGTHEEQITHLESQAKQKQLVSKIKALANKALKEKQESDADPVEHPLVTTTMADAKVYAAKKALYPTLSTTGYNHEDGSELKPYASEPGRWYLQNASGSNYLLTTDQVLSLFVDPKATFYGQKDPAGWTPKPGSAQSYPKAVMNDYPSMGSKKERNAWIKKRGGMYLAQMSEEDKGQWAMAYALGDTIGAYNIEAKSAAKAGWQHKNRFAAPGSPNSYPGKAAIKAQSDFLLTRPYGKYLFDADGVWQGDLSSVWWNDTGMPDAMVVQMAEDFGLDVMLLEYQKGPNKAQYLRPLVRAWAYNRPTMAMKPTEGLVSALTANPVPVKIDKPDWVSVEAWEFSGYLDAIPDTVNPFVTLAPKIDAFTPDEVDLLMTTMSFFKAVAQPEYGITEEQIKAAPLNVKKGLLYALEGGDPSLPPPPDGMFDSILTKIGKGKYSPQFSVEGPPTVTVVTAIADAAKPGGEGYNFGGKQYLLPLNATPIVNDKGEYGFVLKTDDGYYMGLYDKAGAAKEMTASKMDDLVTTGEVKVITNPQKWVEPVASPVPQTSASGAAVYKVGDNEVTLAPGETAYASISGSHGYVMNADGSYKTSFGAGADPTLFQAQWGATDDGDITAKYTKIDPQATAEGSTPMTFKQSHAGHEYDVTLLPGEMLVTYGLFMFVMPIQTDTFSTGKYTKHSGGATFTVPDVAADTLISGTTVALNPGYTTQTKIPGEGFVGNIELQPGSKVFINNMTGYVLVRHPDGSGKKYYGSGMDPKEFGPGEILSEQELLVGHKPLFPGEMAALKNETQVTPAVPVPFSAYEATLGTSGDKVMWDYVEKIEESSVQALPAKIKHHWTTKGDSGVEQAVADGYLHANVKHAPQAVKAVALGGATDSSITLKDALEIINFKAAQGHYGGAPVPKAATAAASSAPPDPSDWAKHVAQGQVDAKSIYSLWPMESIQAYAAHHGIELQHAAWDQGAADDIALHLAGQHPSQLPEPATIAPQAPPVLKKVAHKQVGGFHSKYFWEDEHGGEWMSKPHTSDPNQRLRAEIEDAANRAGRLYGLDNPTTYAMELEGQWSFVQEFRPKGTQHGGEFVGVQPGDITDEQLIKAMQEHVLDWAISNHDTHEGNLLIDPEGQVYGIDKGQAFKFFGEDVLAVGYKPPGNGAYVWYDRFYKQIQQGQVSKERLDKVAAAVLAKAEEMSSTKDEEFRALLEAGLEHRSKWGKYKTKAKFIDAIMERKKGLKTDFEDFYQSLYTQGNYGTLVPPAPVTPPVVQTSATFTRADGTKVTRAKRFYSGVSAESIKAVSDANAFGVPLFFGGTDVEDVHALTFESKSPSGSRNLHSHLKLRKDADAKMTSWIKSHDVEITGNAVPSQVTAPPDLSLVLYGKDTWYSKIVEAAKTVSHHTVADADAPSGFSLDSSGYNASTIAAFEAVESEISASLAEVKKHMSQNSAPYTSTSPNRPTFVTLDQQKVWVEMAEQYLGDIAKIEDAMVSVTKAPKIEPFTKVPKKQAPVATTYTNAQGVKLDVLEDGTGVLYAPDKPGVVLASKADIAEAIKTSSLTEGEESSLGSIGSQAIKLYKKSASGQSGSLDLKTGALTTGSAQSKGYTGQMYEIHIGDDVVIEYQPWNGEGVQLSQQGQVKITVNNHDGSPDALQSAIDLLDQMGVDMHPADELDMEIFYWEHLANIPKDRMKVPKKVQDVVAEINKMPEGLSRLQKAEYLRKAWVIYLGGKRMKEIQEQKRYMPRYLNPDPSSPGTEGQGRPTWLRPEINAFELIDKMSKPWTVHQVAAGEVTPGDPTNSEERRNYRAMQMALTGGILSTEERLRMYGQYLTGLSSSSDQGTGGAASVFTRLNQGPSSHTPYVVSNPFNLLRTHTYSFARDRYGRLSARPGESPYSPTAYMNSFTAIDNETTPKYGLTWGDDVEFITFAQPKYRDEAIAALKARGVTHIRGLPVEQRLILSKDSNSALQALKDRMKEIAEMFEYGVE